MSNSLFLTAKDTFNKFHDEVEVITAPLGIQMTYLLGAILNDVSVDWFLSDPDHRLMFETFQNIFEPTNKVWNFIHIHEAS